MRRAKYSNERRRKKRSSEFTMNEGGNSGKKKWQTDRIRPTIGNIEGGA